MDDEGEGDGGCCVVRARVYPLFFNGLRASEAAAVAIEASTSMTAIASCGGPVVHENGVRPIARDSFREPLLRAGATKR